VGEGVFDFIIVNSNLSHVPTGGQSNVTFDYHAAQVINPHARFIAADVVDTSIPSHHDPEKLGRTIMRRVWEA
jgi:hypothetical protein